MAHTELAKRTVLSDFPPAFFRLCIEQFLAGALYGSLCFCHNQTKGLILIITSICFFLKTTFIENMFCYVNRTSLNRHCQRHNGSTGWLDTKDHSNASHPWSLLLYQCNSVDQGQLKHQQQWGPHYEDATKRDGDDNNNKLHLCQIVKMRDNDTW